MVKSVIKISILLIWLGLMGWWWHESRTWPAPEKIDAAFLPNYNDYFSLKYNNQKIGWSYRGLRRTTGGEYQASQNTVVKILINDEEVEVKSSVLANLDKSLNLVTFTYVLQAGPLTVAESGEVAGGNLSIGVNLGQYGPLLEKFLADYGQYIGDYARQLDFSREAVISPPDGPGLSQIMPAYMGYLGLEPGRNYSFKAVDPAGRRIVPLTVRIAEEGRQYDAELGREIQAFKLVLSGPTGGGTEMWVDRFGRVFSEDAYGFSSHMEDNLFVAGKDIQPMIPPASLTRVLNTESIRSLVERVKEERLKDEQLTDSNLSPESLVPQAPNNTDNTSTNHD